ADKVLLIVKGLLNFARLNESSQKMADIHEGLDSTLVLLNNKIQKQQMLVEKQYLRSIPRTYCQPSELNQVFMSVINNALEASAPKSTLIIRTDLSADNEIIIKFQDEGCGMPPEIMGKIFDPFFTTKDVGKGKGLGLASSLGIVQKHEGNIQVTSEVGAGTTVTITIPVNQLGAHEHDEEL
ncbi:MAG: sensor histidine kinase, partial [Flammeovirgaceae bacterium]